jgi:uncharacterized repeat protein (TIGR03809 family)
MAERLSARALDQVAQKWCDLAERRRAHFLDMYQSGRWRHYYTEEQFIRRMREAIRAAETWARIARLPLEENLAAETQPLADRWPTGRPALPLE